MEQKFYGIATLSERGQLVIPQEARVDFDLNPGDKLIFMKVRNFPGLILIKADQIMNLLSNLTKDLIEMEKIVERIKGGE
ncbi:MAG: AbrB/MazE/SpoVT family DNA-binding domain-containing protein [bacterium]